MPGYKEGRVHCKFCGEEFDRKKIPFVQIPTGKVMRYAHPVCYKNAVKNGLIEDKYEVTDPKQTAMCRVCLKPVVIDSTDCHKDGESYFHEGCFIKFKNETLDPLTTLNNYLMSLCGWESVPPGIQKQIQQIVQKENISYDNIRGTLTYWYTIKGEKLNKDNPVGIVPYVYDQAKNFYRKRRELREKNQQLMKEKEKINYLTIKQPKLQPKKSTEFSFLDEEEQT